MSITTDYGLFLDEGEKVIISIKTHTYIDDNDKDVENAKININTDDSNLEISISKDDLKKLIIAGKKFLESGKDTCFYYDEFHIGDIGDQETIPAKEVLKDI